ncbi:MAG: hypothetical protein A2Y38_12060 [Spirochaetes bacterium GWB1_59_5]|nr:MAG: hypothetical protein A2Y38_12060 [Spirochaetes bacterium GWB1_59_5]
MAKGDEHWVETEWRQLADHHIFKAFERTSVGPHGKSGRFIVLDAPDWATVVPVIVRDGKRYILAVRQFRHGAGMPMTEFPGGVVEPGEAPAAAAARELLEETGYQAERVIPLGACNPNPAFMSNTFHVFAATGLALVAGQSLDEHEIVEVEEIPEDELFARVGDPPWSHALMVTAAWYYRRWRERETG